jgi:hypothetical protein
MAPFVCGAVSGCVSRVLEDGFRSPVIGGLRQGGAVPC